MHLYHSWRIANLPLPEDMILVQRILLLKDIPLFSGMSPDSLALLAEVAEESTVGRGSKIFEKGSKGESLYVLIEGSVRIHDEGKTIATLENGDFFGELSILDQEARSASATAESDSFFLRIDQESFRKILRSHADLAENLLSSLAQRIRLQSSRIVE